MPLLVLTILAAGVVDIVIPLSPWASLPLTAILSMLAIPWVVLVMRETANAPAADRSHAIRRLLFHLTNVGFVLSFLAAKWGELVDGLSESDAPLHGSPYRTYTVALTLLLVVGGALRGGRFGRLVATSADHPARLMAGSFGFASVVGALLLSLPVSLHRPSEVSLVDAFFVSMSAVCVTGLSPVNVADTYTIVGQGIVCALMQVGGLGIMVITAAVTMLSGRRLGVKGSAALAHVVDSRSLNDVRRTVGMIVTYTLTFEAIGAAILYLQFERMPELSSGPGASLTFGAVADMRWAAAFHAVSAFCNGGLSVFREGMVPLVSSPLVCFTVSVLAVLGGLGFPVMHELFFRWTHRLRGHRPPRLTLNTRVVLATTSILLAVMAIAYLALENDASFAGLGLGERLNAAIFQSVVVRSAGFNIVDVGQMRPATLLITCFAMFIGGSPGSIAGGIKVTTFAVLFAAIRGELRGQTARLFDRNIPDAILRRATGIGVLAVSLVCAVVFVLLIIEDLPPLPLTFEVVSAFSTTGLSTGLTAQLSTPAKLIMAATMLVGRIGPLTAAVALAARGRRESFQLPEERVMIG
jgi:trk system potassium uptake protein TrkH